MLHKFGRSALMLLIFCSLGIASLAFAKEDTTGKITGSEVNMRSAPNQEADVVLKMSVGEKMCIRDRCCAGGCSRSACRSARSYHCPAGCPGREA